MSRWATGVVGEYRAKRKQVLVTGGQVVLSHATYLGGHASYRREHDGTLFVNSKVVGVGAFGPSAVSFRTADITSVEIEGEIVAKSKVGATIMFGVLGGLAAKGSKSQAGLTLHLRDGQSAYFRVDNMTAIEVRAKISPVLRAAGVPFEGEQAREMSSSPFISSLAEKSLLPHTPADPSRPEALAIPPSVTEELKQVLLRTTNADTELAHQANSMFLAQANRLNELDARGEKEGSAQREAVVASFVRDFAPVATLEDELSQAFTSQMDAIEPRICSVLDRVAAKGRPDRGTEEFATLRDLASFDDLTTVIESGQRAYVEASEAAKNASDPLRPIENLRSQAKSRRLEQYHRVVALTQRAATLLATAPAVVAVDVKAASAAPDFTADLVKLARLHNEGALTDDEFSAAKSKLLEN